MFSKRAVSPEEQPASPGDAVVDGLRAAALCAVTSYGEPMLPNGRPTFDDPNPYTASLTAYDLGRLFSHGFTAREGAARTLEDIYTSVRGTTQRVRRAARGNWVAHELDRLGHHEQAQRFRTLAELAA